MGHEQPSQQPTLYIDIQGSRRRWGGSGIHKDRDSRIEEREFTIGRRDVVIGALAAAGVVGLAYVPYLTNRGENVPEKFDQTPDKFVQEIGKVANRIWSRLSR